MIKEEKKNSVWVDILWAMVFFFFIIVFILTMGQLTTPYTNVKKEKVFDLDGDSYQCWKVASNKPY